MDCWIYPMMNILSLGSSNQNGWKWCYAKQPWWNIIQTWWIKQSHETDSRTWQLINQWLLCLTTLYFSYQCRSSVFFIVFFFVSFMVYFLLAKTTLLSGKSAKETLISVDSLQVYSTSQWLYTTVATNVLWTNRVLNTKTKSQKHTKDTYNKLMIPYWRQLSTWEQFSTTLLVSTSFLC